MLNIFECDSIASNLTQFIRRDGERERGMSEPLKQQKNDIQWHPFLRIVFTKKRKATKNNAEREEEEGGKTNMKLC